MTLQYQRMRAPVEDAQTLQVPALSGFPADLDHNQEALSAHSFELFGEPISGVRAAAREELVALALRYTRAYRDVDITGDPGGILMTGHQPTLFHPGVWYKNFVLHEMSQSTGCIGINLVVDNDHSPLRAINVPAGTVDAPELKLVKFDSRSSNGPFESEKLHSRTTFDSFADRVAEAIGPFVSGPLVNELWPYCVDSIEAMQKPSLAIAAGRHRLEADYGLQNLEVPLSQICQTDSFTRFTSEVLVRAAELRVVYNDALEQYRSLHRIRSTSHPVPALQELDGWIELPFWVWSEPEATRRGLFVKSTGDLIAITDRHRIERVLVISDLPDQIRALEAAGIRLRTRALLTTMYSRLVLSDAFFHGIGGAKYDQLTDQIIRRFWSVEPPTYHTVTATHRLPIDYEKVTSSDVTGLNVRRRDLRYHAELFVDKTDRVFADLVRQKQRHLQEIPANGGKRAWHHELEAINLQLQAGVTTELERLDTQIGTVGERFRTSQLLGSREFSFCLFDEGLIDRIRP